MWLAQDSGLSTLLAANKSPNQHDPREEPRSTPTNSPRIPSHLAKAPPRGGPAEEEKERHELLHSPATPTTKSKDTNFPSTVKPPSQPSHSFRSAESGTAYCLRRRTTCAADEAVNPPSFSISSSSRYVCVSETGIVKLQLRLISAGCSCVSSGHIMHVCLVQAGRTASITEFRGSVRWLA